MCFLLATLALATVLSDSDSQLLVGSPHLSEALLRKAAISVGKVERKDDSGFYWLRLNPGVDAASAKKHLASKGIRFAFHPDALAADANSLPSVERYIQFKRASGQILGKTGEEVGVDFYEALEYYLKFRVDANGNLPRDVYRQAALHRSGMPAATMGGRRPLGTEQIGSGATWSFMGPQGLDVPYRQYYGVPTISGRKNDIQYAPSNPTIMYAASAGGGIWKSTDSGSTWSPKSDGWTYLHTSTVAVHPTDPNIVLAGTGDYQGFFTAQTFGIMRSTDGGSSWTNVGAAQMGDKIVSKIMFDPTDPNIVVASAGRGATPGDLYQSTDGGVTWANTNALDGSWDNISIAGAEISPGVKRMWACGGGTASGTKIAYSDTHGASWVQIANPAGFTAVEQNMSIGASRNDPDGVYVLGPINHRIYKSANGGAAWTEITAGMNPDWSQSDYDNHVTIGNNAGTDTIFVGLISLHASANGGTTWADIGLTATASSKWHNDQHNMVMHPTTQNEGYICGDGGIAKIVYSPSGNSATITPMNSSFGDEQFYAMALHPTNFNFVLGGTQDNSSPASRGNLSAWKNLYAGDGGFCGFNKTSPGIHYTTAQLGSVYRYDTDLDTTPAGITPTGTKDIFVTPLAMGNTNYTDPFTTTGNKLRRYTGSTWSASKTSLSSNADRIYVSVRNGQRIYTCHFNGDLYMSTNNGANLTKKDSTLPDLPIGAIAESATTDYDVVVVLKTTAAGGRAFRCTNINAATPVWTDISGSGATGLPTIPLNAVVRDPYNPNIIYVGSDIGCFMSTDAGATWANMNTLGLPNIHVNDLVVSNGNGYLYAGTFGRGIWRIALAP